MTTLYDVYLDSLTERDEAFDMWYSCPGWRRRKKARLLFDLELTELRVESLREAFTASLQKV